jgi:predicted RND superfamily exporter protein
MTKLAYWIVRYRLPLLVGVALLTVFFAYQLTKLRIDSDILNYLPQDDPVVQLFREVGDKYGGSSLAVVALETEDIFNPRTLARIDSLTTRFHDLPEVSQVTSLTDVLDIKKIPEGIEVGKLISSSDIPRTPQDLMALREYTLSKEMYRGNIVSADGRTTLLLARVRDGVNKTEVATKMREIVESVSGEERVYYGGIPFQMLFLTDIITRDLTRLVPLVALLLAAVLFFSFHRLQGVLLPLGAVLVSTIWTLGLMNWVGLELTIVTAAIPVLLIAIGSAYGIHLLSTYRETEAPDGDKLDHIRRSIAAIGLPIILTGVTTMVGFLAFLFSYLTMTREFGVFASLGVLLAMALSITLIPAILSYLPSQRPRMKAEKQRSNWVTRVMDVIANLVLAHEKLIVVGGLLVVAGSLVAIPQLQREVNMKDYFKPDSEIRQAEEMMEASFGGAIPIQILVNGDIKDPLVLKEMFRFEKYLRTIPNLTHPQSVADLIAELNEQMFGRRAIPDTREGVANLWFFVEGNEVMDQLVADNDTQAMIQAKMGTVNTARLIAVVDSIDHHLATAAPPQLLWLSLDTLPTLVRREAERRRAADVARVIALDAEHHGVEGLDFDEVLLAVTAAGSASDQRLTTKQAEIVSGAIVDYFGSDAADLPIDSDSIVRDVVTGLEPLFADSLPGEVSIGTVLRRRIPPSVYADDPEAMEYAASALRGIVREYRRTVFVDGLTDSLIGMASHVPDAAARSFRTDIQGDMWALVEDHAGVATESIPPAALSQLSATDPVATTTLQTGMPIIFKRLDRSVLKSQAASLIAAFVVLFILLAVRFRSFTGGLISLTPVVATILCNFILMAVLGIPLDVVTVLIGSVAVGIGIDYTIHFLARFQKEFQEGTSERDALRVTLETTGKAIIINASAVAVGFLVLVLGDIVPMQRFGFLIAATMVTSALGAITLLPALVLLTKARFIGEFDRMARRLNHNLAGLRITARRRP